MHPVVGKRLTMSTFALSDFVFMVREDQVRTTAVDVERFAQIVAAHGRAFDVPTRTTATPLGIPLGFTGLGALPEHEVERIALGLVGSHTLATAKIVDVLTGELTVTIKATNVVSHVTAFGLISQTVGLQTINDVEHLRDEVRCTRFVRRRQATQGDHVVLHSLTEFGRQLITRDLTFGSTTNDLVINVSDVTNERHLKTAGFQPATDDVKRNESTTVTDVRVVIDRHATDVHLDFVFSQGLKRGLLARQSRIKLNCHDSYLCKLCFRLESVKYTLFGLKRDFSRKYFSTMATSLKSLLIAGLIAPMTLGVAIASTPFDEPTNETERAALIDRLMKERNWNNALEQIEKGLAANPMSAQLKFKRAVVFERKGNIARAKALLEDLIEAYPEIVEPYNNLAVIYANEGNTPRAQSLLQKAVTINPRFALAHENLGDLYLQKAIGHYKNAVKAQPKNNRMARKLKAAEGLVD